MKTHAFTYMGKTFRSHSIVDMMEQIAKEYGFEGKIDYNDDLNEYLGSFCGKSLAVDGVYVAIKNGVSNFAEMTNRKTGVYCELDLDDESWKNGLAPVSPMMESIDTLLTLFCDILHAKTGCGYANIYNAQTASPLAHLQRKNDLIVIELD